MLEAVARDREVTGRVHQFLAARLDVDVLVAWPVHSAHQQLQVPSNVLLAVAIHLETLVPRHLLVLVAPDGLVPVLEDVLHGIILDVHIHVALGVHEHLLGALLVLETQLVEARTSRRRARAQGALRLLIRQRVGRRAGGVVHAAGDERPVRVTLDEVDDDFLTDARDEHAAPRLAAPRLAHAHPAGTLVIASALPVPVKLPLPPAVLVGMNFFTRRAHDEGRLDAAHHGPRRAPRRPEGHLLGQAYEGIGIAERTGGR